MPGIHDFLLAKTRMAGSSPAEALIDARGQ
jgi:hypothetical protein